MKKFKLNAIILSILSLGTICNGSAFAMYPVNNYNDASLYVSASESGSDSTEEISEESAENYDTMDFEMVKNFSIQLYLNNRDEMNRILGELKKGRLGRIENEEYKLPTSEEFIAGMMVKRAELDMKLDYWYSLINKYNMEKERNLFLELFATLRRSIS